MIMLNRGERLHMTWEMPFEVEPTEQPEFPMRGDELSFYDADGNQTASFVRMEQHEPYKLAYNGKWFLVFDDNVYDFLNDGFNTWELTVNGLDDSLLLEDSGELFING